MEGRVGGGEAEERRTGSTDAEYAEERSVAVSATIQ